MAILRSILAVFSGFLTMAVAVMLLTPLAVKLMHQKVGAPTSGYLAVNVAYSLLAAVAGGFVTARIALSHPLLHGVLLAAFMCAMGALSYVRNRGMQPLWYQVLLFFVPPLCAIAGAALGTRN